MADSVLPEQTQSNQTPETTPTSQAATEFKFSDDLVKNYPSLTKFKDLESFGKSYGEMEKFKGGSLKVPGADAKPEEWDDFYSKTGRPESADKYEFKRPELAGGAAWPEDVEKNFMGTAHKLGLSSKQVQGLMDWFGGDINAATSLRSQQTQAMQQQLEKDWGGDYQKNLTMAQRAAKEFIGDDKEMVEFFKSTGAHQHPAVLKLFSKLGRLTAEDSAEHGDGGNSVAAKSAMEKIAEVRNNKGHPFHNPNMAGHKEAVSEMNKLYEVAYPD